MKQPDTFSSARREFLRFLAASPYVAELGGVAVFLEARALGQTAAGVSDVIANPADALNLRRQKRRTGPFIQPSK